VRAWLKSRKHANTENGVHRGNGHYISRRSRIEKGHTHVGLYRKGRGRRTAMAVHHAIPQALIPAHAAPQQDKPVRIKPLIIPTAHPYYI
jgi:hypothetical protein